MSRTRLPLRLVTRLLRHPNPWVRGGAVALVLFVVLSGYFLTHSGIPASPETDSFRRTDGFDTLENARLVLHRSNDGDSFFVRHGDREFELRLYFVDAPEKYLSDRYVDQRRRVGEQARALGLSVDETVELGRRAKSEVHDLLAGQAFTVHTKWERVYDGDRFYGFVELEDPQSPGRNMYLTEWLIRRGLARIHTKGEDTPNGRSRHEYRASLERLARRARGPG